MTLGEVAAQLGATLVTTGESLDEVAARTVFGVAGIEHAGPGEVAFVANPKYARLAAHSTAAALIVEPAFPAVALPTLRIQNPKLAFTQLLLQLHPPKPFPPGIHPTAVIHPTARLGTRAHIGPYVVIEEGCRLGDDVVLLAHTVLYGGVHVGDRLLAHAHCVIREDSRIGNDVILGNGVVLGGDGFGFARTAAGAWVKTPHPGPVVVEDDVEIQANSCVDRAVVGETRIGRGSKIDNLVQIGHASSIGAGSLLCSQVGLAGSTRIGKGVVLAGQVGVAGHLTVGDGAVATAQTGIPSDVAPGAVVSGYPAMENRAWLRMVASLQRVPELLRRARTEASR